MKSLVLILAAALVLTLASGSSAQTAEELKLMLTGKPDRTTSVCKLRDRISLCLGLRMNFENKGNEPVVIINPTLDYGTGLTKAHFSFKNTSGDQTSTTKIFESGPQRAYFRSLAKYFDDTQPPDNFTITLKPGESFQFEDSLFIDISFFPCGAGELCREMTLLSASKNETDRARALAYFKRWGVDYSEARLVYEFSFAGSVDQADFLESLNNRWRRYGRMPLGPDGTYNITSEPIKPAQ